VLGATRSVTEAQTRIDHLTKALADTPAADLGLSTDVRSLNARLADLKIALSGDSTRASRNEPTPPAIADRVQRVVNGHWDATSAPTTTQRDNYAIAAREFKPVLEKLRALVLVDLVRLEAAAEAAGAPWTPGRVPEWQPE
jgi:hypothetical protein